MKAQDDLKSEVPSFGDLWKDREEERKLFFDQILELPPGRSSDQEIFYFGIEIQLLKSS